jgi:hypothetical protein
MDGELLCYPDDDPPMSGLAFALLSKTNEMVIIYPHSFVLILQADGTWEVSRLD